MKIRWSHSGLLFIAAEGDDPFFDAHGTASIGFVMKQAQARGKGFVQPLAS